MNEARNPESSHGLPLRRAVLVVAAVVGLSTLWGAGDAVLGQPRVWGLLGFELVVLLASVMGILLGLGRIREAPALGAACVAATIFAATTLGRFSALATRSAETVSEGQAVRNLLRDPVFEGRVLAAAAIGAAALLLALGSDRAAWRKLFLGVAMALPVGAVAAWFVVGSGLTWMLAPVDSFGGGVRVVVIVVGGVAMTILASVAVQQVIGAFALRLPKLPGGMQGSTKAKSAGRGA